MIILLFMGGLFYRHEIKRKGILICSLLSIILIIMKWQLIQNKLNGWARLEYWKQALDILKDHPFTGVGLGGYAVAAPYYSHHLSELSLYAHNSIIEFVCETGLIGIIGLLGVMFVIFRFIRKQPKTPTSPIYPFLIATLLLYSFLQITLSYWIFKWLLILLLGSWILSKKIDKDKTPLSANYSSVLILAAGVLVLLIPFWLAPWVGSRSYTAGVAEIQDRHPEAAVKLFQNAIQINPHDGDSYWGLYMLRQNPSLPDCDLLNKAYSRKKLKAFAKERERCITTPP
jgi:O-antigen ligase